MSSSSIRIVNACTHNLKGVNLSIPRDQLTVITGVSGSGKSSLAMDTLYAEGQRQYIESLSTYARQFLNQLQRPDVERIDGLQPTLCIDQKSGSTNPRSTVATVTEIYDYLRLLMARAGTPECYGCGKPIDQQSADQIRARLLALPEGTKLVLMAPVVRGRKGSHRDELSEIRKAGLLKVRVNGETLDLDEVPELAQRKNHTIEAVVDKIILRETSHERLAESLQVALELASGLVSVSWQLPESGDDWCEHLYSTLYSCADCGLSYEELEPRTFSFNSPYGACPTCDGVGLQTQFDPTRLIRDWDQSPKESALEFLSGMPAKLRRLLKSAVVASLEVVGSQWDQPLSQLTPAKRSEFLHGPNAKQATKKAATQKTSRSASKSTSGEVGLIVRLDAIYEHATEPEQERLNAFRQALDCSACGGARLRKEALSVRVDGKNIYDICAQSIADAKTWFEELQFGPDKLPIAKPIVTEMQHRLAFLNKVGVGYLSLSRSAQSLSGGELQRVRLATSIGSGLVGVSYILDEPSIGLHQRDNDRLIESLRNLQEQGNTVIVVEHDEAMMRAADQLVDVGPGAGTLGGEIICAGTPAEVERHPTSLTARYLRGDKAVERTSSLRTPTKKEVLKLTGATLHNLKNVDVEIPLGMLIGVTGVSGSGKSSLIGETLVPAILVEIGQANPQVGPYKKLLGCKKIDKLIEITQTPIGRTPRSTPATYCGVFDLIRTVWANTRDAKTRGFSSSRFSFNAGGGRCSECQGQGQEKIEMNFLPDLYVSCSVCGGRRYNRQTLQVRYRDKTIADVLAMTIAEATVFFENFGKIHRLLNSLELVGLGYLQLGQSSSTLSGGEAQRIKLATELARVETGKTVYFLDEPTTGLHFADVQRLMGVLDGLVERGNTVIVIEHNLDVIRNCDWLIDIGPEGGSGGGEVLVCGPPNVVQQEPRSLTGRYL